MAARTFSGKFTALGADGGAISDTGATSATMVSSKLGQNRQLITNPTVSAVDCGNCVGPVDVMIRCLSGAGTVTIYQDSGGTKIISVLTAGEFCILKGIPIAALFAGVSAGTMGILVTAADP